MAGFQLTLHGRIWLTPEDWMGHANGEMSGRYGKQLLDNVQWRQECAAKVGLGFLLPTNKQPMIDKSGQVLRVEEHEAVAV
jgi:hypothetical protein